MQTECQVTLIIYKNIWMSFTFKKWTLFLLHYLYFYTLSMLCRQRVSNERHFITSSLNMQHSTEKKKKLLYHVYYGTLPILC